MFIARAALKVRGMLAGNEERSGGRGGWGCKSIGNGGSKNVGSGRGAVGKLEMGGGRVLAGLMGTGVFVMRGDSKVLSVRK